MSAQPANKQIAKQALNAAITSRKKLWQQITKLVEQPTEFNVPFVPVSTAIRKPAGYWKISGSGGHNGPV